MGRVCVLSCLTFVVAGVDLPSLSIVLTRPQESWLPSSRGAVTALGALCMVFYCYVCFRRKAAHSDVEIRSSKQFCPFKQARNLSGV